MTLPGRISLPLIFMNVLEGARRRGFPALHHTSTGEASSGQGREPVHMAHLAAGARLALAVEVEACSRFGGEAGPGVNVSADKIGHHDISVACGRTEGPAGDGADVVLELRDGAGVFGPVAGIVDARRK